VLIRRLSHTRRVVLVGRELGTGLYLSDFIRGGVEVLAVEVDDRANA